MDFSVLTFYTRDLVVFALVAGLFGLTIGSFLNVVIYRLPVILDRHWRQECITAGYAQAEPASDSKPTTFNLVFPGSRCPHCNAPIKPWQNIPVVSYLLLKGRCQNCKQKISVRYPIVELLTGILSAITAYRLGPSMALLAALFLLWALIALSYIDFDQQILPDVIVLPFMWAGLLLNTQHLFTDLQSAVIGAAAGYLSLWLVFQVFKLATGKEGMGFGDFKLFALFGAWLGWQQLPLIILLSSAAGAVIGIGMILFMGRDKQLPMPFGPYLCIAGWIALLWGNDIISRYLQFFRVAPFPG